MSIIILIINCIITKTNSGPAAKEDIRGQRNEYEKVKEAAQNQEQHKDTFDYLVDVDVDRARFGPGH